MADIHHDYEPAVRRMPAFFNHYKNGVVFVVALRMSERLRFYHVYGFTRRDAFANAFDALTEQPLRFVR